MNDPKPFRGGRVFSADDNAAAEQAPTRKRYPCFAGGCPMPGTLFPGGSESGTCAWHYGVKDHDIPKVTQVLTDWACVAYEVNEARRALTGEIGLNPAATQQAFAQAWERLEPLAGTWVDELRPGNIRTSKGVVTGHRENYSDWAKRLHEFIGARVVEVLSVNQRRTA